MAGLTRRPCIQVSTTILSALQCRELGPSVTVLEANYGISCDSDDYASYHIAACVMMVFWVVGIPLGMLAVLLRQWRESKRQWEAKRLGGGGGFDAADHSALEVQLLGPGASEQAEATPESLASFHYGRVRANFGFCVDDYRCALTHWQSIYVLIMRIY